jgi:L-cystine uptake protein TcyP (sodium:dicarboxylate symporter family)
MMASYGGLFEVLDIAVLVIFILEIALKMVAHGRRPLHFFHDGWNVFDFVSASFSTACPRPMPRLSSANVPVAGRPSMTNWAILNGN